MDKEGFQKFMNCQKTKVNEGTLWTIERANKVLDDGGNVEFEVCKGGKSVDIWDDVHNRWIELKTRGGDANIEQNTPINHPDEIDGGAHPLTKANQQIAAARKIHPGRSEVHLKLTGKINVPAEEIHKYLLDNWHNTNIDEIYIYDASGKRITYVIF
jgi:hypothetical protein